MRVSWRRGEMRFLLITKLLGGALYSRSSIRSLSHYLILVVVIIGSGGCLRSEGGPTTPPAVSVPSREQTAGARVVVDSASEKVTVFTKKGEKLEFENAAFGAAGVKEKLRRGDDVTPTGKFLITHVSYQSKYHIFIGLNYPRVEDAERGLQRGVINKSMFLRIVEAHKKGLKPPQNTALGGDLGIHGIGRGSPDIHEIANWTAGCIALTNQQVRTLASVVFPGMSVEVK